MAPKINISRVIELEMGINLDHNFTFHFHFRCSNFSQENCSVPVKSSYFVFPFTFFEANKIFYRSNVNRFLQYKQKTIVQTRWIVELKNKQTVSTFQIAFQQARNQQ